MFSFKIQIYECKRLYFRFWNLEINVILLTMGSSNGEGLSQLHLELVGAYKKRLMPQNGQVAVLECFPI